MSSPPTTAERDLVPATDEPEETLRLVGEYRDHLKRRGKGWADPFAAHIRHQLEAGAFTGVLWFGPHGEAVGLASWEISGSVGRRGWVYLTAGFQRGSLLQSLIDRVESAPPPALPFVSWSDEVPGIPPADRAVVFARRGLYPVVRADMRLPPGVDPVRAPDVPGFTPRALSPEDEAGIGDLLFRVYTGEPERALFMRSPDPYEDALAGARELLHGGVGRWLPAASFGMVEGGHLVALTLANEWEGALISEVGVDPAFRRRGLARSLIPRTVDALRSAGFDSPRLVVTLWNPHAVRLYESLGFRFVRGGAGRLWLNLRELGISPPPSSADPFPPEVDISE